MGNQATTSWRWFLQGSCGPPYHAPVRFKHPEVEDGYFQQTPSQKRELYWKHPDFFLKSIQDSYTQYIYRLSIHIVQYILILCDPIYIYIYVHICIYIYIHIIRGISWCTFVDQGSAPGISSSALSRRSGSAWRWGVSWRRPSWGNDKTHIHHLWFTFGC